MKISIALCTYNGEKFLQEQLDSLAQQSCLPDDLVVCDDGSTDATLDILEDFFKTAPFRARIFKNELNLGPAANFAKAVGLCEGEWIFLCDQDDSWLPDKIKFSAEKMAEMEKEFGSDTPILVHSDAVVADQGLKELHPSLWAFQYSSPQKGHPLAKLLNQNLVTGCTAVLNRSLRDKAFPLPETVMMHDWWLALVAATFGQIGYIPDQTLLYRQHGKNDTGAKAWGLQQILSLLMDHIAKNDEISHRTRKQAAEFLKTYNNELSPQQQKTIAAFIDLPQRSYFVRKYLTIKYGLHYQGLLRNIGNLLLK